jgi:hypothetical protein
MSLNISLHSLFCKLRKLVAGLHYRPERHYMRGHASKADTVG